MEKHNNVAKALLDNGADAVHIYRNYTPHVIEADGWGAGGLVFINKGAENIRKTFRVITTGSNCKRFFAL